MLCSAIATPRRLVLCQTNMGDSMSCLENREPT
jgi:hypothetical protein